MTPTLLDQLSAIQSNPEVSGVVLPAIFKIMELWSFSLDDQMILLGLSDEGLLQNWKANPESVELTIDNIERISYILGIFKSLEILLPDAQIADNWLSTPNDNSIFSGVSPKSRLLSGSIADLAEVRDFLQKVASGLGPAEIFSA
ncbi:antitoxin Xre/MbcA/ParS toxin-binding domain-containing protein [Zhongshania sp. BJYM1]|uniref:antitoxin Xre/MbcA/ParS toxin-binding domain-containing protein n=1 Tax=Zhongshania aquatica TaxID=2965069 RepID=UPI0022B3F453|nr:antitoxin Xre/MbcA/ParS toxin-binding domain-containing protein [Marortus sp. BJYM1]